MLTAALLFLFNMGRGNATISHGQWLVLVMWVIFTQTLSFWQTFLWLYVVIIVTIRATRPLLAGINGNRSAIKDGFERAILIMPALMLLQNWWGYLLLGQGVIYYLCRKLPSDNTRVAEGVTGFMIGLICAAPNI